MTEITTNQLRRGLAESRLHRVLAVLMNWASKNGEKDVSNVLLIQAGQLSEWEKSKASGTLSRDELLAQRNRLASSLAYWIDQIPDERPLSISRDLLAKADEKDKNLVLPKPFNPVWWVVLAAIGLGFGTWQFYALSKGTFSQKVNVVDKAGKPFSQKGKVVLKSRFGLDSAEIGTNGETLFDLANNFLGDTIKLRISHPQPYQVNNANRIYTLARNQPINLTVELTHLDKIVGRIIDEKTESPLPKVQVGIQNISTFTDSTGWFELNIPPDKQAQFHTIRLDKKGYKSQSFSDVPIHTQQELGYAMKPL